MSKEIQETPDGKKIIRDSKTGQLQGSIGGEGKNNVPTVSSIRGAEATAADPLATMDTNILAAKAKYETAMGVDPDEAYKKTIRDVASRRRLGNSFLFEKYSSFDEATLEATKTLFALSPSTLSPALRHYAFESWVDTVAPLYGINSPSIYWVPDVKSRYDEIEKTIVLDPNKPKIMDLFQAFRHAVLAENHEIKTLPSLTEREEDTTISAIVPSRFCNVCGTYSRGLDDDNLGIEDKYCTVCNANGYEATREIITVYPVEKVRRDNQLRDIKAWSQSLYYQVKPRLFINMISRGRFGKGYPDAMSLMSASIYPTGQEADSE